MDTEHVVQGVVDSIDALGPTPPSARTLARRLHIAPATLYSSVPAMSDAYGAARSSLTGEIAEPLVDALSGKSAAPLAKVLSNNPSRAVFVTQPTWELPDTADLQAAREGTPVDYNTMVDGLALIGSQFTIDSLTQAPLNPETIDRVAAPFRATAPNPVPVNVEPDRLEEVVSRSHQIIDERLLSDDAQRVQHESLELLARGSAGWSFRALGDRTGIPISRLHRLGSRTDHIINSLAAFGEAVILVANEQLMTPADVSTFKFGLFAQTGTLRALGELYELRRNQTDAGLAPEQVSVLEGVIAPAALALLLAGRARQASVSEVAKRAIAVSGLPRPARTEASDQDRHDAPGLGDQLGSQYQSTQQSIEEFDDESSPANRAA